MTDRFDWQQTYARLERARGALETGGERPPEEVGRILRERAQALAKPREEAPAPTEVLDLLAFSLAGERYAVETSCVSEVIPLLELTPVPCTPPFVLGVVNHRGRILPILDFRRLFDLPDEVIAAGSRVVAVEAGGMTFGIFADSVAGTVRVLANELATPPGSISADRRALLVGVTGDMVAVLDLDTMARDPRIVVNEETG